LKPVILEEFWGQGRLTSTEKVQVPPAFTKAGKKKIDTFLAEYQKALKNPSTLNDRKRDFEEWYWQEYVRAWDKFGDAFDDEQVQLASEADWSPWPNPWPKARILFCLDEPHGG
jgi:type VI secretion system protein ImpL